MCRRNEPNSVLIDARISNTTDKISRIRCGERYVGHLSALQFPDIPELAAAARAVHAGEEPRPLIEIDTTNWATTCTLI